MLKTERHNIILSVLKEEGVVSVSALNELLHVSSMTIRRDLSELEEAGLLLKVHGGAQSIDFNKQSELSHYEKKEINIDEKREVAEIAASLINEKDTIFLGPGTTIELMSEFIQCDYIRIVTNSLPVFEKFKDNSSYEIYLIGGVYRERTGAFVGGLTSEIIKSLKFQKAFIGTNGIKNKDIYTANIEEGSNQKLILDNSLYKIILADHHKLGKEDFNAFYTLDKVDLLVTDRSISNSKKKTYEKYVNILHDIKDV